MKTKWLPVVGYEGLYEVSESGVVRSLFRQAKLNCGLRSVPAKVLKTQIVKSYPAVGLNKNGVRKMYYVHKLVLTAFNGPRPDRNYECCHKNGNPKDNRASNLYWGTRKQNSADRILHGTDFRGVKNPNAKLSEADVIEIRSLYVPNSREFSQKSLAEKFGVTKTMIRNIVHRNSWTCVK